MPVLRGHMHTTFADGARRSHGQRCSDAGVAQPHVRTLHCLHLHCCVSTCWPSQQHPVHMPPSLHSCADLLAIAAATPLVHAPACTHLGRLVPAEAKGELRNSGATPNALASASRRVKMPWGPRASYPRLLLEIPAALMRYSSDTMRRAHACWWPQALLHGVVLLQQACCMLFLPALPTRRQAWPSEPAMHAHVVLGMAGKTAWLRFAAAPHACRLCQATWRWPPFHASGHICCAGANPVCRMQIA